MRFRLLVCLFLVVVFGLFISGCSNSPAPTTVPVASTQETTTDSPETAEPSLPAVVTTAPEIDPSREVIALINGYPAYRDEFESSKKALLNQYAQMYAQFGMDVSTLLAGADGRMFELGIEAEAFQQLVQLNLTRQEADQRGIVITDEDVQQEFDSQYTEFLTNQGWTEDYLSLYLAQQGKTIETFKKEALGYVANQMLATSVQRAVAGELNITDEQLNEHFIENEAEYGLPEQVRASHILVETMEESEEILGELNGGADFAELAREHSTCPSSAAGGDLDWFGRGAMVPAFDEAVFALEVGDISGIVGTEFGYHIILLTDRQDATSPELADIIDQVRADVENKLSYERALVWYEGVYNSVVFDIRLPLLDAIIVQTDDLDAAIEILEQAQINGTSDDPYLPFVLATFYERKLNAALTEKTAALAAADGVQNEAEITALNAQISEYRTKALAALRMTQESVGQDLGIQSTIDEIEALTGGSEEQTP